MHPKEIHIGIDIEQFVLDPFASGVQRVLQYIAKDWPQDLPASFVVPMPDHYKLLTSQQAFELISIPFDSGITGLELGAAVAEHVLNLETKICTETELMNMFTTWFLPEVSYDPGVLKRFRKFHERIPTAMIGHDVLPMTDPRNYMLSPGTLSHVSEYFRLVAITNVLICNSEHTKSEILRTLRRSPSLITTVAHPGGDHIPAQTKPESSFSRKSFLRLGTIEARKAPLEILHAFEEALNDNPGLDIELHFVGKPASVDIFLNDAIERAISQGLPIRWTQGATDVEVHKIVRESFAFLAYGTEGYGIPVLESIRLGTPVLFDGIQPAAELMEAHGAYRVQLDRAFTFGYQNEVSNIDQGLIPSWSDFVHRLTQAIRC